MDQLLAMLTSVDASIKAEHDCAKAAVVVREAVDKNAAAIAAMSGADAHARADADAEAWAFANYGQKIKPLMEGVMFHECATNDAYKAALATFQ